VLDGIIRTLALTVLDADNPQATVYQPYTGIPTSYTYGPGYLAGAVAQSSSSISGAFAAPYHNQASAYAPFAVPDQAAASISSTPATFSAATSYTHTHVHMSCGCDELTLGRIDPSAHKHTPMWLTTPAWQDEWSEAEVRREGCRRLAWSAMTLAAGYSSYASATGFAPLDLFITEPTNVSIQLCFFARSFV